MSEGGGVRSDEETVRYTHLGPDCPDPRGSGRP